MFKCQVRPLNQRDNYDPVAFTDAQWTRLEATFPPGGGCDWTKSGVDQVPTVGWMTYADGPGPAYG